MAVETEQLPVAAVGRVVVVIVIAVVNCQLTQIRARERSSTAATGPRIDLQRSLAVALGALIGSAPRFGHDAIEPARISWFQSATSALATDAIVAAIGRSWQVAATSVFGRAATAAMLPGGSHAFRSTTAIDDAASAGRHPRVGKRSRSAGAPSRWLRCRPMTASPKARRTAVRPVPLRAATGMTGKTAGSALSYSMGEPRQTRKPKLPKRWSGSKTSRLAARENHGPKSQEPPRSTREGLASSLAAS